MVPSNDDFASLSSSSTVALGSAPRPGLPSYDSHLLPTTQPFVSFEHSWHTQLYTSSPPGLSYTPTWMSSAIEYGSRLAPRQETYSFSPPTVQAIFDPATSPYHRPREVLPNVDSYVLDSPYEHYRQSQISSTPSVSLPQSSSYFQGHYFGPH
jgi:hypothetical protein